MYVHCAVVSAGLKQQPLAMQRNLQFRSPALGMKHVLLSAILWPLVFLFESHTALIALHPPLFPHIGFNAAPVRRTGPQSRTVTNQRRPFDGRIAPFDSCGSEQLGCLRSHQGRAYGPRRGLVLH